MLFRSPAHEPERAEASDERGDGERHEDDPERRERAEGQEADREDRAHGEDELDPRVGAVEDAAARDVAVDAERAVLVRRLPPRARG